MGAGSCKSKIPAYEHIYVAIKASALSASRAALISVPYCLLFFLTQIRLASLIS